MPIRLKMTFNSDAFRQIILPAAEANRFTVPGQKLYSECNQCLHTLIKMEEAIKKKNK